MARWLVVVVLMGCGGQLGPANGDFEAGPAAGPPTGWRLDAYEGAPTVWGEGVVLGVDQVASRFLAFLEHPSQDGAMISEPFGVTPGAHALRLQVRRVAPGALTDWFDVDVLGSAELGGPFEVAWGLQLGPGQAPELGRWTSVALPVEDGVGRPLPASVRFLRLRLHRSAPILGSAPWDVGAVVLE